MKSFIVISTILAVASAAYSPFGQSRQPAYRPQVHHYTGNEIPILRQAADVNPDGEYSYSYETGNGIAAAENGVGGHYANGNAQWTAPDGTPVQFTYTADENGYQAQGAHIPTPPPVPEQILRALEYIRTHPNQDEQQYRQPTYNTYKAKNTYNTFRG